MLTLTFLLLCLPFSYSHMLIVQYANATGQQFVSLNPTNTTYNSEITVLASLGLVMLNVSDSITCKLLKERDANVLLCDTSIGIQLDEPTLDPQLDPKYQEEWGLPVIKVESVWASGYIGNKNIIVCVIDTGIDVTHPDLQNNFWVNPGEIPNNGVDDDNDGIIDDVNGAAFINGVPSNDIQDLNGHGTMVSGVIGAIPDTKQSMSGVSPKVSLLPCRYMDENGLGNILDAILCINYCVSKKATVINMSWGYDTYNQVMDSVMATLQSKSILVVCSAGNDGYNSDFNVHYPSYYSTNNSHVVSVGGIGKNLILAAYSNYGNKSVDIVAPGNQIYSTYLDNAYSYFSGTSASAPFVTGAAVLLKALYKNSNLDIKNTLIRYSTPMSSNQSNFIIAGILDVENAAINVNSGLEWVDNQVAQQENYTFTNNKLMYVFVGCTGILFVIVVILIVIFTFMYKKYKKQRV